MATCGREVSVNPPIEDKGTFNLGLSVNDGDKGTAALLSVEPDVGVRYSRRVWLCDGGSSPDALFSARVVVCVDPTLSSRLLSTLGLVVCCGNSAGDL